MQSEEDVDPWRPSHSQNSSVHASQTLETSSSRMGDAQVSSHSRDLSLQNLSYHHGSPLIHASTLPNGPPSQARNAHSTTLDTNPNVGHIPDSRRFIYHQVTENDSLASIAILYGIAIADLKQSNSLLSDADLLVRKNIRIPKAKCRISHGHQVQQQASTLAIDGYNYEDSSVNKTTESKKKNTNTANELFAAIDMDMEQAMQNMKSVLEDSSVGLGTSVSQQARSFFSSPRIMSKEYSFSAHPSERQSLMAESPTDRMEAPLIQDGFRSRTQQSIYNYSRDSGMYIDDSETTAHRREERNRW